MNEELGGFHRDPAGFIVKEDGIYRRIITPYGRPAFDEMMRSGFYDFLNKEKLLVEHREIPHKGQHDFKKIEPQQIPVVSYPFEWCFSQLKEAALLTLNIQSHALRHGFSLKDATPFNVQFIGSQPIWIDTLSFELIRKEPWIAYRQFCETFLAPLSIMARGFSDINKYLAVALEGIRLDWCSRWLPKTSYLNLPALLNIHLHARNQKKFENSGRQPKRNIALSISKQKALVDYLRNYVSSLHFPKKSARHWRNYYENQALQYSPEATQEKINFVESCIMKKKPKILCDLGSNTGKFGRLASEKGIYCVAIDHDSYCVEEMHLQAKSKKDDHHLSLLVDLVNPSPALGWCNRERPALLERLRPDLCLALALVHHLKISRGIDLRFQAEFLAGLTPNLLIEFIGPEDPMVARLLAGCQSPVLDYNERYFEEAFGQYYRIEQKLALPQTHRCLYEMSRKQ